MEQAKTAFQRWFPNQTHHNIEFHTLIDRHTPKNGKILDFGCGDNGQLIRHQIEQREIWGTDFGAHPELKRSQWYRPLEENGRIPFEVDTFDVVCSHMVMEHVAEPVAFLNEIARVLKPGGVYVGQSIHSLHYVTWIRRAFDLVPHSWVQRLVKTLYGREEHDTFPTCYRMNSRRTLRRHSQKAALEWVDWHTYPDQGYFAFSALLRHMALMGDWCLDRTGTGLGRIYFTVVLRKPIVASDRAKLLAHAA